VNDIIPLSENMASLSEAAYKSSDFKDIAYFEPFYLKEFISTKPKNKVF
jgi:tRNA threonylcarbamoyladenosine biosynthesis protein TsaB